LKKQGVNVGVIAAVGPPNRVRIPSYGITGNSI
jgi:hypothetical protein